jgi:hypothetical protein
MVSKNKKNRFRRLFVESLEDRRLMTLPFGAVPSDLGEFMLGRVAVTPVLLESDGRIDPNTEDWTPTHVAEVERNIREGLQWWTDLLATQSSLHTLEWVIDTTYLDNRPPTPYEPISRISNNFTLWVGQFLTDIGYGTTSDIATNIRAFNHDQRVKHDTDWSFTIFVVNSSNDADGAFAPGGSFSRAFAFAGGLFQVIPSTRPASTYAHETGHMFWARDEYSGGGNFFQRRGYYDSQNMNAVDLNPNPNFVQAPSIMSAGSNLQFAYDNLITSPFTLAQLGWLDSNGNQIFDVLDVPLDLKGTGRISLDGQSYNFVGTAAAKALHNRNSSGNQNDITLNRINRIQYRINGGNWTDYSTHNTFTLDLNLNIPIPQGTTGTIEIRALSDQLGITSNLFVGSLGPTPSVTTTTGIQGFVWEDSDQNRAWSRSEHGLAGVTVAVVDQLGNPLSLQRRLEPDDLPPGEIPTSQPGLMIDAIGMNTNGRVHAVFDAAASTGVRVFKPVSFNGTVQNAFRGNDHQLRIRFDQLTSYASIDAIAAIDNTRVLLEAFDSNNQLITRSEHRGMAVGQKLTLEVGSQNADISYVIARAFSGSSAMFDNFRYGSPSTAITASDGSYRFPFLPAGTYNLRVTSGPLGGIVSSPESGLHTLALSAGQTVADLNFGLSLSISPWRNTNLPEDIDNDGLVTPLDVLTLINEINQRGSRALDGSGLAYPPFYDPNGDRFLDALDVLMVINFINSNPNMPGGEFVEASDNDGLTVPSQPIKTFALDYRSALPPIRIIAMSGFGTNMVGENELHKYQCDHDHSDMESFAVAHPLLNKSVPPIALSRTKSIDQIFSGLGDSCCCPSCGSTGEGEGVIDLVMTPNAICTKDILPRI